MWAVTSSMWAVTGAVWAVTASVYDAHALHAGPFNPFYKSRAIYFNSLVRLCRVWVALAPVGVSGGVTPDNAP